MNIIPQVIKQTPQGTIHSDIYSRLLDDRTIMLDGEINDQSASIVIAQLLYLESKSKDKDIYLYINSPGGSVSAGLAIIDTMHLIKPDVVTIGTGMCASMGAMILSQGQKNKRYALPHAEVMIHQPLGGAQGQATDIQITAKHIEKTKNTLINMLLDACSLKINEENQKMMHKAIDRDNYLSSKEAIKFGLIDKILEKR